MPVTKSPLAFEDCRELMNRALESDRGIRVPCGTVQKAKRLRARMFTLRSIDRRANLTRYPADSLLHENSEFDKLVISIPKDEPSGQLLPEIHIIKRSIEQYDVSEL